MIEVLKFDDKFKMKKSIILAIPTYILFYVAFTFGTYTPIYKCSTLNQYLPPTLYLFIITCII